jgi:hypothetical protein
MSLQSANLGALYARHPHLAEKGLEKLPGPATLRVVPSRCGAPTAIVGQAYLHSRYDPLHEAQRLAASSLPARDKLQGSSPFPAPTALIFYGFGLGYLVEAFAELHPQVPMVVVEASLAGFAAALRERDLRELLARPNVRWHLGEEPEAVLMSVDGLPLGGARIVRLRAAVEADASYYHRLDGLLQSLLDKREVNANTLQRFGRLWVRNLLSNLEAFVAYPGITELAGIFAGLPALVLAAGPSLDELLPHLPALRERMLIVAVDTSHRFCVRQGFEPDLLVSVDPQYWNTRHLDWLPLRRAILVCESAVNPRLFHRLAARQLCLYWVSSFFPLGQLLERTVGQKGAVGAGGSVSTTAWDVARVTGASPIYLGGLDLGFPGKRTHARGAFFEERLHSYSSRLLPAEQGILSYLCEAGPIFLRNNAGGRTLTDRRMLIYKAWFEDQMKQQAAAAAGAVSYNLSSQGLHVEGLPVAPLQECLGLPPIRQVLGARLDAARRRGRGHRPARPILLALRQTLEGLRQDLGVVQVLSRRGESICSRLLGRGDRRDDQELLAELDGIDREILSLSSRQIAAFLLQPLIGRILDGSGRTGGYREILTVSRDLYSQMASSTHYHSGLLQLALRHLGREGGT